METAAAAAVVTVNFLTSSSPHKRILSPARLPTPRNLLALCAFTSQNRNPDHRFLTRCSTKRDLDNETSTNNPAVESNSSSEVQQPPPFPNTASSSSSSKGLVFDLGPSGSWDSREIGSPIVKRYLSDDEERWYMWYHGTSHGADSIGLAVSSNGVHWERGSGAIRSSTDVGLILPCSGDWWAFDTNNIRPSEVLIMSSNKVRTSTAVYWLYYTGFNSEKIEFSVNSKLSIENPEKSLHENDAGIYKSLPGLAISQDGRHWARIEGEHHSGALFDVGADGDWDSLFIVGPKVVYHRPGDLRTYYHSFDVKSGCFCIGIARSRDGMRWVKLGKILGGGPAGSFDEKGVMNGQVVAMKQGKYVMAYEGIDADGRRSIGIARSEDGLKEWSKCENGEAVLMAEENGWDSRGVGSPCLVRMDGDDEWRLYYRGIGEGGRTGIGMAISQGCGLQSFRRWAGFPM